MSNSATSDLSKAIEPTLTNFVQSQTSKGGPSKGLVESQDKKKTKFHSEASLPASWQHCKGLNSSATHMI